MFLQQVYWPLAEQEIYTNKARNKNKSSYLNDWGGPFPTTHKRQSEP